jgi:hypothetical protein
MLLKSLIKKKPKTLFGVTRNERFSSTHGHPPPQITSKTNKHVAM